MGEWAVWAPGLGNAKLPIASTLTEGESMSHDVSIAYEWKKRHARRCQHTGFWLLRQTRIHDQCELAKLRVG